MNGIKNLNLDCKHITISYNYNNIPSCFCSLCGAIYETNYV